MGGIKGLLMFIVLVLGLVAFINRGQLAIGTGPTGANLNVGYYGLVK
jgi:hypothetical protein